VEQIEYVHDRDKGRAFVNTAMKLAGFLKGWGGGNFLIR
jgi:hypothetical protein